MTVFVKGQKIRVSKIVEVGSVGEGTWSGFLSPEGKIYLPSEWTMEILEPDGWPVQPGDVWKAGSVQYMAYIFNGDLVVRAADAKGLPPYSSNGLSSYKPMSDFLKMNPLLVYRRGK